MLTLRPKAPYNFAAILARPLSRPSAVVVADAEAVSYARAVTLRRRPVGICVRAVGTTETPLLELDLPDDVTDDEAAECLQRVAFMLSTDVDLALFHQHFAADAVWEPVLHRFHGLRPIRDADLFESMVKIIIGQQLNVRFAATLVERLVKFAGVQVSLGEQTLPVFPGAATVASWSYEDLRRLSFSQRKAEYVIDLARSVVNGDIHLEEFWNLPDEEVIESLTRLRGIGQWTAECLLLFGLGRPDVIPAADVGVQIAAQRMYGLPHRPHADELRVMAEDWSPWRSYTTYYLWNSLILR